MRTSEILNQILEKISPEKNELKTIDKSLKKFLDEIEKRKKKLKINAEIFVGGSYAKKTLIKKDKYDIDIFLRFGKEHRNENISELSKKILKGVEGVSRVHGSRDYFRIKIKENLFFEIVPVIKVKNPKMAENITDLSYSHVKYINKKIKSEKILKDIRITKAFCYANECYGAESYIKGFSGYGLELLIYYYGSFLKFVESIAKSKKKIIIDIEKQHKSRKVIMMDINESKLQSPIILIDPTYKQRNVLAALSEKTFERFKKNCKKFLRNPSAKSFEVKKTDLEKIKKNAERKKYEFILLESKTSRQEGDIAGSKLLKFFNHLEKETERNFEIKNKGFEYNGKNFAECFFVVKKKKEILIKGPFIKDKTNVKKFKAKHKNVFEKKGKLYSKKKIDFNVKEFIEEWKKKNKKKIKDMGVSGLKII